MPASRPFSSTVSARASSTSRMMPNSRGCASPGPDPAVRWRPAWFAAGSAFLLVAWCAVGVPADATTRGDAAGTPRGGSESQIDESSPDESAPAPARPEGAATLPDRLREYVEGSLSRYDALKSQSVGFRRQGWFPSLYLRDPARDVVVEPGSGGGVSVTVHISCARRDIEQRLVVAPADRFELPDADRRFMAELIGALATAAPEVGRAGLYFWFASLRADGRMTWELRGGIGISAAAARRFPAGSRTAAAVWPLLEENTLPASLWNIP